MIKELQAALCYPRLRPYLKMTPKDAEEFVLLLEQVADPVDIHAYPTPGICRDPRDEPYLQTALAGRADYIVTGDADLLTLGEVEGISILPPADFERILNKPKRPR
jgi:putative PIN family toxin of toxin-antitoxin system